eukprot:6320065-Prymnesium_polylepis.2
MAQSSLSGTRAHGRAKHANMPTFLRIHSARSALNTNRGKRAFPGDSSAAEGDPRRVGTAMNQSCTPAARKAALNSILAHEDAKPTISGSGMRGSKGARRAAN